MDQERLLVVAMDSDLVRQVEAVAGGAEGLAPVITDAVSRRQALRAIGQEIPEPVGSSGRAQMVEVWLPGWVLEQIDGAVGATPALQDRSSVLAAAVQGHLQAIGGSRRAPSVDEAPLSSPSQRQASIPSAGAPSPSTSRASRPSVPRVIGTGDLDWASRAERSTRRLETLVNGGASGPLQASDLFPPADLRVSSLKATEVQVGLRSRVTSEFVDPAPIVERARRGGPVPVSAGSRWGERLSGLTNRVAPTLWATSLLVRLQETAGGQPIDYPEFVTAVMGEAWAIGEGLRIGETVGSSSRFAADARWRKLAMARRSPDPDADPEAVRAQRLAQAATGFIEYSLIAWRQAGRTRPGSARGPMHALGLADAWLDTSGVKVAVRPAAVPFLQALGAMGASCEYPHSLDAWTEYQRYLLDHERCTESHDMLALLRVLAQSTSRGDFYESAATLHMSSEEFARRRGRESKAYSTDANGSIGRLREWGLVSMDPGTFGWAAITQRGRDALEGLATFTPPDQLTPAE